MLQIITNIYNNDIIIDFTFILDYNIIKLLNRKGCGIMKVETIVSLTKEEKEAFSVVYGISCEDILCSECPFKDKQSPCCLLSSIQCNIETILKNLKERE